jgi:hypothetical protein
MKRVLILVLALSVLPLSSPWAQAEDGDENSIKFNTSIGLGSTLPLNPDEFKDWWDPSVGFMVDVGAARGILEASLNIDYSMFLTNAIDPIDINILTAFINLKIKPLNTTARPYIFVGGGLYRFWIVDLDTYENVLGFGGGAGIEIEIDDSRRIFIEGKAVQGQTRLSEIGPTLLRSTDEKETIPFRKANVEIIPIRTGITFVF